MKSVIQSEKRCFICGSPYVHEHHIFEGTANRKLSEKYGMKCYLCQPHHTGDSGVHFNKSIDNELKKYAQRVFEEKIGTREDFRKIFGKSWIMEDDE